MSEPPKQPAHDDRDQALAAALKRAADTGVRLMDAPAPVARVEALGTRRRRRTLAAAAACVVCLLGGAAAVAAVRLGQPEPQPAGPVVPPTPDPYGLRPSPPPTSSSASSSSSPLSPFSSPTPSGRARVTIPSDDSPAAPPPEPSHSVPTTPSAMLTPSPELSASDLPGSPTPTDLVVPITPTGSASAASR
ncbi:hypothetical protein AB0D57_03020 [Streptomyces sp. NPDC048275]|uniref:hypothetical protein n=1 Tax=Streptomyces sp. NPDC048275 TaxID=3155629 RepID=UPI00340E2A7F